MTHKSELGKYGEDLACEYLVKQSFTIIERNFRKKWGELDIIAMAPDKTLVFVEVKAMRQFGNAAINPEDNLTAAKLRKLQRTVFLYANEHPELINEKKGWRIDLIAITLVDGSAPLIKHFENC
jgi:putative endonuclease